MATRWKTEYTGPVKNRGEDSQGRALVSAEELADFRRKYGSDKTLRDLLNADRTGNLPSSAANARARGVQGANISPDKEAEPPRRAEIPTGGAAKGPAESGDRMSPLEMGLLTTAGALAGPALGRGALAAYRGAKGVADTVRGAVQASRGLEEARRARLAREMEDSVPAPASAPELGKGVWRSAREKAEAEARNAKPRMQVEGTKGGVYRGAKEEKPAEVKPEFRSRTADRMDEREMGLKRGGKVKAYKSGGSVRGAGIAQRGVKQCKVY